MKSNNNSLRPSYDVVSYDTDSGKVSMDIKTVKDILAVGSNVTDSEVIQFMQLCKYRRLNPFTKQAYLVKFKDKADIIVGIDVFTQRLTDNPACEGWECGVIVLNKKNEIIRRAGTFYLEDERLVGAYCDIKKKGWKDPFPWTIRFKDFHRTYTKNGKTYSMGQWATMPGVMLTKCAIVSAVRKVFGEEFGGMYAAEEMGVENNVIDANFTEIIEPENDEKIKELTKLITDEQIKALKEAAKTDKASYDSEKMVSYVLEQLNIHNGTNSKKIEELQNQFFDLALTKIKETRQAAENKAKKESIKKEAENKAKDEKAKNENKEKKQEVETDLPVPEVDADTAKPANTKKDEKEVKDDKAAKDKNKK